MRHMVSGRKLGRTTAHRWAMFKNQLHSLVTHGRIETTLHKAKELRSFADHLITLAKDDSLSSRRSAFWYLRDHGLVSRLFTEVGPRYTKRQGGYTRVLKLGYRLGDSAAMAIIEYVDGVRDQAPEGQKTAKKAAPKKAEKNEKTEAAAAAKKEAKAAKKAEKAAAPKAEKAAPKAAKAKAEPKAKAAAKPAKKEAAKAAPKKAAKAK